MNASQGQRTKLQRGCTSVSLETKLCLWASITCAHESGHLLEKLSFSVRRRGGEHSKPTSWYKFAKRNTGPIVCGADAGCIQIESLLKCPLPCMAQWLMYNKSTKGGFNSSGGQVRGAVILSFFFLQYLIGTFPRNITPRFQMTFPQI